MTLLAAMRNDPTLSATNGRFRELTGVQDSRAATRELGELVSRGILALDGNRGGATYWLSTDQRRPIQEPRQLPMVEERSYRPLTGQQERILGLLDSGDMSRAEIVESTGLSSTRVASTMQTLRDRGLVEMIGVPRSRNARWRRSGD